MKKEYKKNYLISTRCLPLLPGMLLIPTRRSKLFLFYIKFAKQRNGFKSGRMSEDTGTYICTCIIAACCPKNPEHFC